MVISDDLPDHRDPVDRLIVATAAVLGLTLVTADRSLLGLGTIATLANLTARQDKPRFALSDTSFQK